MWGYYYLNPYIYQIFPSFLLLQNRTNDLEIFPSSGLAVLLSILSVWVSNCLIYLPTDRQLWGSSLLLLFFSRKRPPKLSFFPAPANNFISRAVKNSCWKSINSFLTLPLTRPFFRTLHAAPQRKKYFVVSPSFFAAATWTWNFDCDYCQLSFFLSWPQCEVHSFTDDVYCTATLYQLTLSKYTDD